MLSSEWDQVMQGLVYLVRKLTGGSGNPLKGFKQSSDIINVHFRKILAAERRLDWRGTRMEIQKPI